MNQSLYPTSGKFQFKIVIVVLFIGLATITDLQAQLLNVERIRSDADSIGWHGDIGFNFSVNRLNDRVIRLSNSTNTSYNSLKHTYLLLTSLELVNVDGTPLVSSGYFHLRSQFVRDRTFSPELFVQYQYNENLGLDNRSLAGGGVRFNFLQRDRITGSLFSGVMFEYEEWSLTGEESITNNLWKSTSNIGLAGYINPQTRLLIIGYYQARPDRFFETRATLESQLNVRISRFVTFAVSFTMTYDTDPVIDIPELTYELKNGLLINF